MDISLVGHAVEMRQIGYDLNIRNGVLVGVTG